jgi:hypothetical protein
LRRSIERVSIGVVVCWESVTTVVGLRFQTSAGSALSSPMEKFSVAPSKKEMPKTRW